MAIDHVDHVDDSDHKIVTDAVAAAEHLTNGEIVTIVTDLSDHYNDVGIAWATAFAFAALATIATFPAVYLDNLSRSTGGWEHEYTEGEYLALVFMVMAVVWIATWLLMKWIPLRMKLTPQNIRQSRVRARAIAMFKVGTESKTVGRTGVLLYLSMKEHRAEIVADEAIAGKVDPAVWGDAMIAMLDHVKAGRTGEGMAEAVKQMGVVLAEHFPKGTENPNELPDRLIEL